MTITNVDAHSPVGMLEVTVQDAKEVDQALESAIEAVNVAALAERIGIMVTRIGAGHYIVRAHPQVPHGLVRQRYA